MSDENENEHLIEELATHVTEGLRERPSAQCIALKPRPKVELLGCPWCGAKPRLAGKRLDDVQRTLYWYVCENDACGAARALGDYRVEDAQTNWNTRKPTNAPGERPPTDGVRTRPEA